VDKASQPRKAGGVPGDWCALVRLTTKGGAVLADVGETCERVPASSMTWLIAQGLVTAVVKGGE